MNARNPKGVGRSFLEEKFDAYPNRTTRVGLKQQKSELIYCDERKRIKDASSFAPEPQKFSRRV